MIINVVIFILFTTLFGLLNIKFGQVITYDFLNYHYYAPYAALNQRIGIDILPSDIQSYFNPFLDYPVYFLIKYFNNYPLFILFLNGLIIGLYFFIFYKFMGMMFQIKGLEKNIILVLCVSLAASSPILLTEFSISYNDIPIAISVMLTLYIILKEVFNPPSKKRTLYIIISGLIMGLILGLKLAAVMYCVSFIITLFCLHKKISDAPKTIIIFCICMSIGFIITNGYWMYLIYTHFKNPFFPYFNNIFNSPYTDAKMILDSDYQGLRPQNLQEFIFYPFLDIGNEFMRGCERLFYDLRYAATYISIFFLALIYKTGRHKSIIKSDYLLFLLIFITVSYFIGILLFAQYRYFIALNSLGIAIIIVLFYSLFKSNFLIYFTIIITTLMFIRTTVFTNGGIIKSPDSKRMIEVKNVAIEDNALVLLASRSTGFIIPFQNPNARYAYLAFPKCAKIEKSYFPDRIYYRSDYIEKKLKSEIGNNLNNLYIIRKNLFSKFDNYLYIKSLNFYTEGKFKGFYDCKEIKNNIYPDDNGYMYNICKIKISKNKKE